MKFTRRFQQGSIFLLQITNVTESNSRKGAVTKHAHRDASPQHVHLEIEFVITIER